ncbi:hypothetical protein NLG97_g3414 [Lecanicillium saksenae]|uniref:Uncharacterized protein n=1 Tax=Lecanicillium saksenae TaxID=468837 RepID=A0ACC1QZZ0_9HYPO|nr:hypothetical protein NLG97_g3414 [Lecanicillium saksenae]
MTVSVLPLHDLEMSEPASSEVHQFKGETFYCWILSDTERAHIADMLQMDVADLKMKGSNSTKDRAKCRGCGKYSGFDDFVHNALYGGVHSVDFMRDYILGNINPGEGRVTHDLTCSRCSAVHDDVGYWDHEFQWRV